MPLLLEYWKPVVGFEEYYAVSNLGSVYSIRARKLLRGSKHPKGYLKVDLYLADTRVSTYRHSLVAEHFIGARPVGKEINHIDGWKPNCRASNLEYINHMENMEHASGKGLIAHGEKHYASRLTANDVSKIRSLIGKLTHREISAIFGVSREAVSRINQGRNWKHIA